MVCHLSKMFLSSVVVATASDVMSSEFLCELLVSAALSRMLVFGCVLFVCDLVFVLSGSVLVMSFGSGLVSVVSGVFSVMSLASGLVSVVSGVFSVMSLASGLVSVVSG